MRRTGVSLATLMCGTVVLATAIGGCAVDGTPVRTAATSVSPDGAADPSRSKELVLDAAAFPSGYRVMEVPRSQLQSIVDQMLDTTRRAKVQPAECVQLSTIPERFDVDDIGMVTAVESASQTRSLAESITVVEHTLEDYRQSVDGRCGDVVMTMSTSGQQIDARVTSTIVDGPAVGVDTVVVEQETVGVVAGSATRVRQKMLIGYAKVKGYMLSIQSIALQAGVEPDRAGFDDLFTKAVAKVAADA